jgi:septal ring factor EnvC (AmiA/AmiB activator)
MNGDLITSKLTDLEFKLKKLIAEHESLKASLQASRTENEALKNIIREQNEEIKNFQNQEKITKIVSSIAEGTQNNTELKLKINEYIKEIDRCIVYLSE